MNFFTPPSHLEVIPTIAPATLADVASTYTYDPAEFHAFEQRIWNRIRNYGGDFGHSMIEHLSRASQDYKELLLKTGFNEKVANNLAQAYKLHDADKILLPTEWWNLEGKPSTQIKENRKQHVLLGARVLEETLLEFPHVKYHPHLEVIKAQTLYHHERINGSGPHKLKGEELGKAMQIGGIADTVDGKTIPRGERRVSLTKALQEMTGSTVYANPPKHVGEFDPKLLADCINIYQERSEEPILPPIGHLPQILAM